MQGKSYTRVYQVWKQMVARCTCATNRYYHNYGGRGIRVCNRWRIFENFYADMGDPLPGYSLERLKVNRGYWKANCCWATRAQQNRNYRHTRNITWRKQTMCLKDWNDHFGLKPNVLASRLKRHSVRKVFGELST